MQTLSGNQRPDLLTSLMNMPLVLCLPGETPKSGPSLVCFCAFWLPHVLCAATECTFSTCQLPKVVLCAFWLPNVLRATTARAFWTSQLPNWTSQLPKMVRAWCVLYILTSKFASRHNGVQLFISHLASWLRTRRFSEPTFRPSGATNHWKNTVFRDFPTFSRTWIFFLLTLSLLWSSLFYSSLLSDSSRLCFSSVHIVGSLTSKLPYLPSIIIQHVLPCLAIPCVVLPSGMQRQKALPLAHLARWSGPTPLGASCSRSPHLGGWNPVLSIPKLKDLVWMTGDYIPDHTWSYLSKPFKSSF